MRLLNNFNLGSYRLFVFILISVPFFLAVDSKYGDNLLGYGQQIATLLVFFAFIFAYNRSVLRIKQVMLIGIVVGLAGEFFFSKVLGMYHYRFENIPLWLAFAHGLIFAVVYKLSHRPDIKKKQKSIQNVLLAFACIYSFIWLIFGNDWYGFICTLFFMIILFTAKKSRLFFLLMFVVVCYIELVGTATGCWYWPEIAFGSIPWLPSTNPPSGIAVFYFLFDAVVFYVYLHILNPRSRLRYQRMLLRKSLGHDLKSNGSPSDRLNLKNS